MASPLNLTERLHSAAQNAVTDEHRRVTGVTYANAPGTARIVHPAEERVRDRVVQAVRAAVEQQGFHARVITRLQEARTTTLKLAKPEEILREAATSLKRKLGRFKPSELPVQGYNLSGVTAGSAEVDFSLTSPPRNEHMGAINRMLDELRQQHGVVTTMPPKPTPEGISSLFKIKISLGPEWGV